MEDAGPSTRGWLRKWNPRFVTLNPPSHSSLSFSPLPPLILEYGLERQQPVVPPDTPAASTPRVGGTGTRLMEQNRRTKMRCCRHFL